MRVVVVVILDRFVTTEASTDLPSRLSLRQGRGVGGLNNFLFFKDARIII